MIGIHFFFFSYKFFFLSFKSLVCTFKLVFYLCTSLYDIIHVRIRKEDHAVRGMCLKYSQTK